MHLSGLHKFLCTALMACSTLSTQALDDKTLLKLIDHGSTKLAEMEREYEALKSDPEQRDYARDLKKDMDAEKRRCSAIKTNIRALAPKVKKSGKINMRDEHGRTLIMLVAAMGNDTATALVLRDNPELFLYDNDNKIAIDYENEGGGSTLNNHLKPLWEKAVLAFNQDEIQNILDCGANPDWPVAGQPPLALAIQGNQNAVFDRLMLHGAHAGNRTQDGTALIELAVAHANANAVDALLSGLKETDIIFSDGSPIFRHLMDDEHKDCLIAWLNQAQSLNKFHTEDGTSYFCLAMRLADTECAKYAATQNLKLLSTEDKEGNLPLHEAARRGNAELYRELVKLGASPAQKNSRGETALMHAALSADADTLAEALKGITPELLQATDNDGNTALYYAKLAKDQAATEALKAAGLQHQKKN